MRSRHANNNNSSSSSSSWLAANLRYLVYLAVVLVLVYLPYSMFFHDEQHSVHLHRKDDNLNVVEVGGEVVVVDEILPNKQGFYAHTTFVQEVASLLELQAIKEKQQPSLIVFYASWCAHCKKFAPTFIAIAEKVTQRILLLNQEYPQHPYPSIHFYAMDCAKYKAVCDHHKVEYYPVVLPNNFPPPPQQSPAVVVKENKFIEGIDTDIYKFLQSTIFQHNELDQSDKNQLNAKPIAGNLKLTRKHVPMAHITTNANDRYFDALSSLFYLLVTDLPSDITQTHAKSLRQVIDFMFLMMPNITHPQLTISKDEYIVYKQALSAVKLIMLKYSKSPYVPKSKIIHELQTVFAAAPASYKAVPGNHLEVAISWKVCGMDSTAASKWSLSLRGASTTSTQRHQDPSMGYTCGLWMMFHYFSVQGEVFYQNQYNITAVDMMQTMHDFISIYFGCKDCRSHFLFYYEKAWFQRDLVQRPQDFEALQSWLFQLHNLVSARILLEAKYGLTLPVDWTQHIEEYLLVIRESFWPSTTQCEQCYSRSSQAAKEVFGAVLESTHVVWEDLIREVVVKSLDMKHSLIFLRQAFLTR